MFKPPEFGDQVAADTEDFGKLNIPESYRRQWLPFNYGRRMRDLEISDRKRSRAADRILGKG
jgi:hypothetical protein